MADIGAEVEEILAKGDLGIKEDERIPVSETLTPIDQITPDQLEKRVASSSLFEREEEPGPLTERQAQLALASLQVYSRIMAEMRERAAKRNGELGKDGIPVSAELREYEHIGENPLVVGRVRVTPEGARNRYVVSFTATNIDRLGDRRTQSSALMFDEQPIRLDTPSPHRMDRGWIAGRKNGQTNFELVGRHGDLHREGEGLVAKTLQEKGYVEVAEIEPMDLNRHTGFLEGSSPNAQPAESVAPTP